MQIAKTEMKSERQRQILVANVWFIFMAWIILTPCNSSEPEHEYVESKIANDDINPGFISIDCGAAESYTDETTGIWYEPDTDFVQTGTNSLVNPSNNIDNPYFGRQLSTVRSFPEGGRNCYTLKPKQGKGNNYLIRAFFSYGNYDNKNEVPIFNLYLGAYYWDTINLESTSSYYYSEVNYMPLDNDIIHVCLVNTGQGIPFISSLELRVLNNSLYQTISTSLPQFLQGRYDLGSSTKPKHSRGDYAPSYKYYVYLYFAEIEQLAPGKKRIINITVNDENILSEPITLDYMKPITVSPKSLSTGYAHFTISATAESAVPPILNALDVYRVNPQPYSPTDIIDVNAILEIKITYAISIIDWQGDPCVPSLFTWHGLNCSSGSSPRIISVNLSSSKLKGDIASSFSNLTKLKYLDLSNNDLTGPVPEFLAQLPNLEILLDENTSPSQTNSRKKQKFLIPVFASIAVLAIIILFPLFIWKLRRRKRGEMVTKPQREGSLKSQKRVFTYSQVVSITNDFRTIIGEGGFGKVYLGVIQDDTEVAVKLLSLSSMQGFKEFQSEVQLLMILHHRNLVSLIGYCDEGDVKALIYEYMANGNLHQKLSDRSTSVLAWKDRLQIAVDAAYGIDYLHNGCKPPIIHRDLKTSNILLNENMQAKIADFGLSRAFGNDKDTHVSTCPAGTPGYLDPEFYEPGCPNRKSDVYSFGIILLELITGQPAVIRVADNTTHILDWVIPLIGLGDTETIMDPRLQGNFSTTSALKAVEIAMSCTARTAIQRPDISHVLSELKECLSSAMAGDQNAGMSSLQFESQITEIYARYKDDVYDCIWFNHSTKAWTQLNNTSADIDTEGKNDAYKLPAQVWRSAVSYQWEWSLDKYYEYYIYFHFVEIKLLAQGQRRIANVMFDGENVLLETLNLEYLKPLTISPKTASQGSVRFTISASPDSDVPPILNAFEVFRLTPGPNSPTDARYVTFAEAKKEGSLKLKNRAFSYSEVLKVTNNFKTIIGEGGFGKVYHGTLQNDTKVAVKLLSPSSMQGYREFRPELWIILFELITGQPAIRRAPQNICHILHWVGPEIERGDIQTIIDPRLEGKFSISSTWKAVEIAMSCIPPAAIQRQDIAHTLAELKECLALEMVDRRAEKRDISSSSFDMTLQLESEFSP
ncbi:protein kinase family protein [Quillaja saponaria]|uniref:non-specific serine/threonine protein kinase n=1 Tax=Quillaja saponaria TaxID=32244 RepID=A0AAD7L4W7_QUISA|nr:protein kinase family protein [Quillaja saponaria]